MGDWFSFYDMLHHDQEKHCETAKRLRQEYLDYWRSQQYPLVKLDIPPDKPDIRETLISRDLNISFGDLLFWLELGLVLCGICYYIHLSW